MYFLVGYLTTVSSVETTFCYLRMLSVSKQCTVDDRMISECGAVGGMRTGLLITMREQ
jgi:hypothetical protein